jgi:hypothetical protein
MEEDFWTAGRVWRREYFCTHWDSNPNESCNTIVIFGPYKIVGAAKFSNDTLDVAQTMFLLE